MARVRALSTFAALFLAAGCVQDPKIEDEVPPQVGITQPASDGSTTIGASEACRDLVSAEMSTRRRLGCDDAGTALTCPTYVRFVGAVPCGEYDKSTVESCVSTIGAYESCQDFDTNPCVVTVVRDSCRADAGSDGASSSPHLEDASIDANPPEGSTKEAGADGGDDAGNPFDAGRDR